MNLNDRLAIIAGMFSVLIIDDGDAEKDEEKGYDALTSALFSRLFRVDRAYHFNQRDGHGQGGLQYLLTKKYDLIHLDRVFRGQPDQGYDIAWAIRDGLRGYHGISAEQGGRNKEVPIFGISPQWNEGDKGGCGLDAIIRAEEGCDAPYKLKLALCEFLAQQCQVRGYVEREGRLREMFPGEELQRCSDLETDEVHAWGPPHGAFIRVSTDALLAWHIHFPPGAVYRIGKMDTSPFGATHEVPLFLQPTQEQSRRWNSGLLEGATRVPAPGIPRLLDLAKWAVMEDATAGQPNDLASTIEVNWVAGAKKYGLTILELTDESNLTAEGRAKGFMPVPDDLRPWMMANGRKLGDIAEYDGHRLVLIAFILLCDVIEYTAFVPVEEIQL